LAELRTERLLLRHWRDDDVEPFAALSADPEVMRFYPATLSLAESEAYVDRARAALEERGWGLWAVEETAGATFLGVVGLHDVPFRAHFTPAVEVGWRLARAHWGRGYATEAARASLAYAFGDLGLDEVVSFTTRANERSRRVMERLGLTHDPADDFDHPALAPGHPLRRHVLYRLARTAVAAAA
jgi:RimJ/RimL family protein N-acetyltransferase